MHLAPLHRQRDGGRRRIAGDKLELCSEDIVQERRHRFGVVRPAAADDQLLLLQIFKRFDGGRVPGDADRHFARETAQPVEFSGFELRPRLAHDLDEGHQALHLRHYSAVFRRGVIEKVCRNDTAGAGHVLHDDGGITGNELAEMARKQAGIAVIPASGF
jgi:hypothetical protein